MTVVLLKIWAAPPRINHPQQDAPLLISTQSTVRDRGLVRRDNPSLRSRPLPESMSSSNPHRRAWALAALWLVPLVWSSNYLIARAAAPIVPAHVLAFGRWGIVCAVLLTLSARSLRASPGRVRKEWR